MNIENILLIFNCFWMGVLISISPCPLATNISSLSFIINNSINSKFNIIEISVLYSLGRILGYFLLALLIIKIGLSIPELANFLTINFKIITGIILLFSSILILDIIQFPSLKIFSIQEEKIKLLITKLGKISAIPLGFIFALSFCPISAGLFFGNLIPLAISKKSIYLLPISFGLGSSLIVLLVGISFKYLNRFININAKYDIIIKRITAIIFFITGTLLLWEVLIK